MFFNDRLSPSTNELLWFTSTHYYIILSTNFKFLPLATNQQNYILAHNIMIMVLFDQLRWMYVIRYGSHQVLFKRICWMSLGSCFTTSSYILIIWIRLVMIVPFLYVLKDVFCMRVKRIYIQASVVVPRFTYNTSYAFIDVDFLRINFNIHLFLVHNSIWKVLKILIVKTYIQILCF